MQPRAVVGSQDAPAAAAPAISVVIPARNAAPMLERSLDAVRGSRDTSWECIVVDDGSTDDSARVAQRMGMRVLENSPPGSGPARARNLGGVAASAPLICFVDADVVVRPDTLARFTQLFQANPELSAAFGSYDAEPSAPGLLSQYRNLLHHFVHQTGREEASTFWAGCGAIRRTVFTELGGFDPAYARPSVEDIELGYRLHARGERIRLAKDIQVTHLKRWTLGGMLKTDIWNRALPWTALIFRTRHAPDDLNLGVSSRASALCVYALGGLAMLGWWQSTAWLAALLPLVVLVGCNRRLYAFFLRQRGAWFLLRVLPLHWLYYAYSTAAFVGGMGFAVLQRVRRHTPRQLPSKSSRLA